MRFRDKLIKLVGIYCAKAHLSKVTGPLAAVWINRSNRQPTQFGVLLKNISVQRLKCTFLFMFSQSLADHFLSSTLTITPERLN